MKKSEELLKLEVKFFHLREFVNQFHLHLPNEHSNEYCLPNVNDGQYAKNSIGRMLKTCNSAELLKSTMCRVPKTIKT